MQAQEQAEGKQGGLLITLICVVVMLALIGFAVREATETRQEWDNSVGVIMERDFRVSVANVVAQAQLQGRVKRVEYNGSWVEVNHHGQPSALNEQGEPDCAAIWQQVMGMALDSASYPMTSVLISDNKAGRESRWRCRYLNRSGAFFEYALEVAN